LNSAVATIHQFDREKADRDLETFSTLASIHLEKVRTGEVDDLGVLAARSLTVASLLAALQPDDPELVSALRTVAQAGAALFALARSGGAPLDAPVGDDTAVRLEGRVSGSTAHAGVWLNAWRSAMATRDAESLALLASTPLELVRASSTTADEFQYLLVDALRLLTASADAPAAERLLDGLEATDPEAIRIADADWVLDLRVPEIDLLLRIVDGDAPGFAEALQKALDLHRRYWERGGRANDPEGLLALGPLAAACLALERRQPVEVSSPYIPARVLRLGFPETLVLCPYCLTPIAEGTQLCPACLEDTTRDAPIEVASREWFSMPRRPCGECGTLAPEGAVRCPACRTRF
jgi:hypothetical protein